MLTIHYPPSMIIPDSKVSVDLSLVPSPQAVWAQSVEALLKQDWNWDEIYLDMLASLAEQDDMDPVVKIMLWIRLVELQISVNPWHQDTELEEWLRAAKAINVNVSWMSPKADQTVDRARREAAEVLHSAPSPSELLQRLRTDRSNLFSEVQPRDFAGILWADDAGGVVIKVKAGADILEVVVRDTETGDYRFHTVGHRDQDRAFKLTEEMTNIPIGTPIFFKVTQ